RKADISRRLVIGGSAREVVDPRTIPFFRPTLTRVRAFGGTALAAGTSDLLVVCIYAFAFIHRSVSLIRRKAEREPSHHQSTGRTAHGPQGCRGPSRHHYWLAGSGKPRSLWNKAGEKRP